MPLLDFRSDRLITLGLVDPVRSLVGRRNQCRVPILMYHSISEAPSSARHPYFVTETVPSTFRAHMEYLKRNGYTALSPDELVKLVGSGQNGQKAVVITFDDGYRDFYTTAFPILEEFGLSAIVYLPTKFIGSQPRTFLGKECLTWAEVRELEKAGMHFGSHTVSHPKLRFLSTAELDSELCDSKKTIEDELGSAIQSFAYPYAFPEEDESFISRLQRALEECGYKNGVSTTIGSKHSESDKYFFKRLPANSWDDPKLFVAKLNGSYDWLYWPQHISKQIKFKAKH
jgi:peptidoglycan/xylan/chitin deacetylase (PgdA/CDA1 family)